MISNEKFICDIRSQNFLILGTGKENDASWNQPGREGPEGLDMFYVSA